MLPVVAVVAGAVVAAVFDGVGAGGGGWADAIAWQNDQWNNRTGGRQAEYERAVWRARVLRRPFIYVRGEADLIDPDTGAPYEDDSRVLIITTMLDTVVDQGAFWEEVRRIAGPYWQAERNIFNR